jgi:hypothetical protein
VDQQERARLLGIAPDSTPQQIEDRRKELLEALDWKPAPRVSATESPELRALIETEEAGDHEEAYRIALGMLVDFDKLRADDSDGLVALSNEYKGSYDRYRKAYLRGEK